jgi:hypothetical protein
MMVENVLQKDSKKKTAVCVGRFLGAVRSVSPPWPAVVRLPLAESLPVEEVAELSDHLKAR